MHCRMQMPVKTIIRENGKQCMMQMPVKTTLRLYCDNSHLVSNACEIINVLRHSRLVIVDCLLNRHYKKKITWTWMMEMPVKTTLRSYCDDSHLVSSVWNYMNLKGTWSSATKFFFFFFFFSQCVNYMCEGVTRGQSRPIDLKSSFIFYLICNLTHRELFCLWQTKSVWCASSWIVLKIAVNMIHGYGVSIAILNI